MNQSKRGSMSVFRAALAGLVLIGVQPTIVEMKAQSAGPGVVAAVNGNLGGKAMASKASANAQAKAARSSITGKSKRSALAIVPAGSRQPIPTARSGETETVALPAPPARGTARVKKNGR
jgi:hypothetical protein